MEIKILFINVKKKNLGPKFDKYDYGWILNLKHYGQLIPPAYDLSKVTVPVHIFHGHNDYVAVPKVINTVIIIFKIELIMISLKKILGR